MDEPTQCYHRYAKYIHEKVKGLFTESVNKENMQNKHEGQPTSRQTDRHKNRQADDQTQYRNGSTDRDRQTD